MRKNLRPPRSGFFAAGDTSIATGTTLLSIMGWSSSITCCICWACGMPDGIKLSISVLWASFLTVKFPSTGTIGWSQSVVTFRFLEPENLSKIRFWIKTQFWKNKPKNVWLNQEKLSLSLYDFQFQIMHSLWCVTDFCRRR